MADKDTSGIERLRKLSRDVAALLELADKTEKWEKDGYDPYWGQMQNAAARIRKAVDGATVPDAESDAERACAALMEWRDQVAGLLGIDAGSMADEVQDAIMAELDKRLMPAGMEWLRYEDSEMVLPSDEGIVGIEYSRTGNTVLVTTNDDEPRVVFATGERVKRPEPEALGADGKPIKVGETVWYDGKEYVVDRVYVVRDGDCSVDLEFGDLRSMTNVWPQLIDHNPPDTQERIDEDKRKTHAAYWGCDTNITCSDCPAVIDGMKPYEYYGVLNCRVAQGMDIARRKHELDAKTMGGDA